MIRARLIRIMFVVPFGLFGILLPGASQFAFADGPAPDTMGATVEHGTCYFLLPSYGVDNVLTGTGNETQTPSGNATLECHFSNPAPPSQTIVLDNVGTCDTSYGPTTDDHVVISAGGTVSLICHYRAP